MAGVWDQAIEFVLKEEGGYVNDPVDPGGETNWGIAKRYHFDIDIKNLKREQAIDIYRREYWDECRCDELPPAMAVSVFDCAVNQGTTKAKRLLQISVGANVDGFIGPKTVAAAHKAGRDGVVRFLASRLMEYARIMLETPGKTRFGLGWMRRVVRLADIVLEEGFGSGQGMA
jgi:lysozyme family protein